MDDYKKKIAVSGSWGRKERKQDKASARAQLKSEIQRIANLSWNDLVAESRPLDQELFDRVRELTKDVKVDLDAPIEDECD